MAPCPTSSHISLNQPHHIPLHFAGLSFAKRPAFTYLSFAFRNISRLRWISGAAPPGGRDAHASTMDFNLARVSVGIDLASIAVQLDVSPPVTYVPCIMNACLPPGQKYSISGTAFSRSLQNRFHPDAPDGGSDMMHMPCMDVNVLPFLVLERVDSFTSLSGSMATSPSTSMHTTGFGLVLYTTPQLLPAPSSLNSASV